MWSLRAVMLSFVVTFLLRYLPIAGVSGWNAAENVSGVSVIWLTAWATLFVLQGVWWTCGRWFWGERA